VPQSVTVSGASEAKAMPLPKPRPKDIVAENTPALPARP
jgi:hypothetical protein